MTYNYVDDVSNSLTLIETHPYFYELEYVICETSSLFQSLYQGII